MQHRTAHRGYYIPEVQTKDYNLMVDGTNAFDQRMQNYAKACDNIKKFLMVKEMITQLVSYLILHISNKIIK